MRCWLDQVAKARQNGKWLRCECRLSEHGDSISREVSEEPGAFGEVRNALRRKTHQSATGSVSGHRIVGHHNLVHPSFSPLQRPIAFHYLDSISYHKVNERSRADVQDALVNPMPVQDVLRPTILHPRHDTEHILQTQRDARPVMCLDLRHGYDE